MDKFTCIVADDEPLGREVIETFIKEIPFLTLVASFGDSVEALLYLQNHQVDIMFSDIQMPKINGMELVHALVNPPVIIFVTAHRDFALDSFDAGATDYLVKPVRFDRFLKAVNRAKERVLTSKATTRLETKPDRIFIKSEGRLVKIVLNEILYIEAQGDYLKIVIPENSYTTQATLKSMDEILDKQLFFRVQRSFILNIEAVKTVSGNMIELTNGKSIAIALNKKEEFFKLLGIK